MKKKLALIFTMVSIFSSCSGKIIKNNQKEHETKIQTKESQKLEEDNSNEKISQKNEKDNVDKKIAKDKTDQNENQKTNTTNNQNNSENKTQTVPTPSQKKSYVTFTNPDLSDNSNNYPEVLNDLNGKEFRFSSGAGGWWTILNFTENGNFTGVYKDYDAESVAVCEFNGKFSIDSKVDETSYTLRLDRAEINSPVNTEEVQNIDGQDMTVKYVDLPYGFEASEENIHSFQDKFTLYLPLRKRSEMSDDVNYWLDITINPFIEKDISRVYILVNEINQFPFREQVK